MSLPAGQGKGKCAHSFPVLIICVPFLKLFQNGFDLSIIAFFAQPSFFGTVAIGLRGFLDLTGFKGRFGRRNSFPMAD
jgi:hypothetical protein